MFSKLSRLRLLSVLLPLVLVAPPLGGSARRWDLQMASGLIPAPALDPGDDLAPGGAATGRGAILMTAVLSGASSA